MYPKQRSNLVALLEKRGFEFVETVPKSYEGLTFELSLYFTRQPQARPVKWIKQLQSVFNLTEASHDNYAAAVLVSWNGGEQLYAASYGIAHFYLSRFADLDFGIEIASRLLATCSVKNSREFGGVRTKSIQTFRAVDDLAFEPGESVNYIKGAPSEPKQWGKSVSCGQSVSMRKRDMDPSSLHVVSLRLHNLLAAETIRDFPRSTIVSDKGAIDELRGRLISDMVNGNYMVSISDQQLSGVDFLFSDAYDYQLCIGQSVTPIDDTLSIHELNDLVETHFDGDYERLLLTTVEASEDGASAFSKPFMFYIDYVDSENNYYLNEGQWYRFDSNYLANVRYAVDRVELERAQDIPLVDEAEYQFWRSEQHGSLSYREHYFNSVLATAYHYENRDRTFDLFENATVEISDLVKDDSLYVVKIGKPQKLGYAVDQASAALSVLARRAYEVEIDQNKRRIRRLVLWFVLDRATEVASVTEINSLIFLTKLAQWRRECLLSELHPVIRVSYLRR